MINEILLRRKNKILINTRIIQNDDNMKRYVVCIMKNIEQFGYTFSETLFNELVYFADKKQLVEFNNELVGYLKQLTGADKEYTPFYPNFPEQVMEMDETEWIVNALVHYWSGGVLIPDCEKTERLPLVLSGNDLTVLEIGQLEDLNEILNNLIGSKTSLSAQDTQDMVDIINMNGVDNTTLPEQIPFKENLVVIAKVIMQNVDKTCWFDILSRYFKTATDVLRLATALSDGDVSLKENTKYKSFSRKTRMFLLQLLENCNYIEEDMQKYRMKWLRLGETLHPAEFSQYRKVNIAFSKLRNNNDFNKMWRYLPKEYEDLKKECVSPKITTYYGKVDAAFRSNDMEKVVHLLKKRPGEFARKIDSVLRDEALHQNYALVIDAFAEVATEISVPVLLQVREHFIHRNDTDSRVFFPKGQLTKGYVIENNLKPIPDTVCRAVAEICEYAMIEQFKEKEPLNKVYISETVKGFCVPFSQRSASSGKKIIVRGSRVPFKEKFIRFFIRWENEIVDGNERRTDMDLSCVFLDEEYNHISTTAYYSLMNNNYSWHSGDFVDAPKPNGACEFIDVDVEHALNNNVRYAVMEVCGYTNTKMCDLENMYAGWMERTDLDTGEVFEPATVQNKMNLTGKTDYILPLVLDLKKKEVVLMDMALTSHLHVPRNAANNMNGARLSVKGILEAHKPQIYDLIMMNVKARGTICDNRNEADVIFDTDATKPTYVVNVEVQNEAGEVIEVRTEERVKENVKIVTPYDVDVFMGDLL